MSDRYAVVVETEESGHVAVICTSHDQAIAFRDTYEALGGETVGLMPVQTPGGLIRSLKQASS